MLEGRELSVGEIIVELKKTDSEFNREKLLAVLIVFSWFRNNTGKKARAFLFPNSVTPFILTKNDLVRSFREGISEADKAEVRCG